MENQSALQQEERDAELARQLHEEINGPAVSQENPQNNIVQSEGGTSIACPACTFVNSLQNIDPERRYKCIQCYTALPIPQTIEVTNSSKSKEKLIKCSACLCLNRMPQGNFDAIVCGGCCHDLKNKTASNDLEPSVQTPVPKTRRVQVRCGECSSINAVQIDTTVSNVRFECGSCQTVNEVSL